jgi:hypothetical protein
MIPDCVQRATLNLMADPLKAPITTTILSTNQSQDITKRMSLPAMGSLNFTHEERCNTQAQASPPGPVTKQTIKSSKELPKNPLEHLHRPWTHTGKRYTFGAQSKEASNTARAFGSGNDNLMKEDVLSQELAETAVFQAATPNLPTTSSPATHLKNLLEQVGVNPKEAVAKDMEIDDGPIKDGVDGTKSSIRKSYDLQCPMGPFSVLENEGVPSVMLAHSSKTPSISEKKAPVTLIDILVAEQEKAGPITRNGVVIPPPEIGISLLNTNLIKDYDEPDKTDRRQSLGTDGFLTERGYSGHIDPAVTGDSRKCDSIRKGATSTTKTRGGPHSTQQRNQMVSNMTSLKYTSEQVSEFDSISPSLASPTRNMLRQFSSTAVASRNGILTEGADTVEVKIGNECTFKPKMVTKQADQKRTLDEFLEAQSRFIQQKASKQRLLRQEREETEQEQLSFRPSLSKKSLEMVSRRQTLGGVSTTAKDQKRVIVAGEDRLFRPAIDKKSKNLRRDGKVEDLLYQDAMARLSRAQTRETERENEASMLSKKEPSRTLTFTQKNATNKMICSRFMKQFNEVAHNYLDSDDKTIVTDGRLSLEAAACVMFSLGFLSTLDELDEDAYTQEKVLLLEIWEVLEGEPRNGIKPDNLAVFLLAILGLDHSVMEGTTKNANVQRPAHAKGNIAGFFDNSEIFHLSPEEIRKIQTVYDLLRVNRLKNESNVKGKDGNDGKDCAETPHIDENSRQLAENYRGKLRNDIGKLLEENAPQGNDALPEISEEDQEDAAVTDTKAKEKPKLVDQLSHIDLMIIQKQAQKEAHKQASLLQEQLALQECTFQPQRGNAGPNLNTSMNSSRNQSVASLNKCFELYAAARRQEKKVDKTSDQIEFERNREEFTFKPSRQSLTSHNNTTMERRESAQALTNDKEIDKAVERMRKAREMKEQEKDLREQGYHLNAAIAIEDIRRQSDIPGSRPLTSRGERSSFMFPNGPEPSIQNTSQLTPERKDIVERKQSLFAKVKQIVQDGSKPADEPSAAKSRGLKPPKPEQTVDVQMLWNGASDTRSSAEPALPPKPQIPRTERETKKSQVKCEKGGEKIPLLYVDVNISAGKSEKIVVYPGDIPDDLATKFALKHSISPFVRSRINAC